MSDKLTRDEHVGERAKIGEIIAEIRLDKAITQDELAKRAGISRSSLTAIENGKSNFTVDTLIDIANALDIPMELIFLKAFFAGKALKLNANTSERIIKDLLLVLMQNIE